MISSKMVVDITELPYGVDPNYMPIRSATVTTSLDQLDREREARAIPWWIMVLAAVVGVLLLAVIIFVLWKVYALRGCIPRFLLILLHSRAVWFLQAKSSGQGRNGERTSEI